MYAVAPQPDGALDIEDRIVSRCAHINAELRELFRDIAAFDRREAWRADGAHSMAHWLQMRTGASERTAKDWASASNALESLPRISESFSEGRLSWDQLRPLASFATADDDARLASEAPGWTPSALEDEARTRRRLTRAEANDIRSQRCLKRRWDRDTGMLHFWGQVPHDAGAIVEQTFDRMARQAREAGIDEHLSVLRADALTELCSSWVAGQSVAAKATLVVHVKEQELAAVRGMGELHNGVGLCSETVRRVSCDGKLQMVAWSAEDKPVGVGKKTRAVPDWLRELVAHRDKGCRFAHCGRTDWTDMHHIVPWSRGGPTDLANLCQLCGYHHTLVHEGGWKIIGKASDDLDFVPPVLPMARRERRWTRGP